MPCPLNCTEPCQRCYEKVIAGVTEYRCYGQCVVVDQMGISHNGPGEAAPAGWTLSPEVTEEMAAYTAMYNSEQTPTSQLDCCTLGNCSNSSCWTNGVECRCSVNKPGDAGTWKPASKPTVNVDRLTQTAVEEQKAALTVARSNFNSKQTPTSQLDCCSGGPCPPGNCWSNNNLNPCKCQQNPPTSDPGKPVWKRYVRPAMLDRLTQTTVEEQKAALTTARKAANFDRNSTIEISSGYGNCCLTNGTKCKSGQTCFKNTTNNNTCFCHTVANGPLVAPQPPLWLPCPDGDPPSPPTTALTPTVTTNNIVNGTQTPTPMPPMY